VYKKKAGIVRKKDDQNQRWPGKKMGISRDGQKKRQPKPGMDRKKVAKNRDGPKKDG
jgi:hypothetical protein